jgi:hypothetical protein
LLAGRCLPQDFAVECARPHVEPPVVPQEVAMGQPERLVIDEQLDGLGVCDVADRLAGLGKTVGFFTI